MENSIIDYDGRVIPLSEYQAMFGLEADKLSENFSIKEKKIGEFQPFTYARPLIVLIQAFRHDLLKPVVINSGFRTREKQIELIKQGERAASYSPHEVGMAFDIDTVSCEQTQDYVKRLRSLASMLKLKIRIGYKQYWNEQKYTFIHVDVCPMYYGQGMPFHNQTHPRQWENSIEW
jgi:uncharacterized protein YcbK (DUF882 family)